MSFNSVVVFFPIGAIFPLLPSSQALRNNTSLDWCHESHTVGLELWSSKSQTCSYGFPHSICDSLWGWFYLYSTRARTPLFSPLFCTVSTWLSTLEWSSKLSTSFSYLLYLHVYWIILYSLPPSLCFDIVYGQFYMFVSLCGSCMMGKDIRFRKLPVFHRNPVFFQMNMFIAFT